MKENFDKPAERPAWVMRAYWDYVTREQAWWEFLRGTGLVGEAEMAWVLWGQSAG